MVNVTLINGAGETFTFADGEVQAVNSTVNADIEQLAFPGIGPASAFGFDFNGPIKIIRISGVLFETTATRTDMSTTTTILQQKQWLEENVDGFQLGRAFTSNYESQSFDGAAFISTNVLVGTLSFNEQVGNPETLIFNINLLVGS